MPFDQKQILIDNMGFLNNALEIDDIQVRTMQNNPYIIDLLHHRDDRARSESRIGHAGKTGHLGPLDPITLVEIEPERQEPKVFRAAF